MIADGVFGLFEAATTDKRPETATGETPHETDPPARADTG
jgi:hypothetical protein